MGTTTSGRRPEAVGTSVSRDTSPAPHSNEPIEPTEVLIKEARHRQRRRWAFSALVLLATAGLVVGLMNALGGSPPPTRASHVPAVASPSEVAAFAVRAEKGFSGHWLLRYSVQYGTGPKAVRGTVVVAQLSKTRWAYFSTPPVTDIGATGATSSIFVNPIGEHPGRYLCTRHAASSPWSCSNFSTALMGENAQLLGPYPPTALIRGLQNAIVSYSGQTTGKHIHPQPAHLVARQVDSRKLSCLAFGKPASPDALVCLNVANLIASYDVPSRAATIAYTKTELRSQSRSVAKALFRLPAIPSASR